MSVRLYVGNLPKEPIERQALQDLFGDAGESVTTKVIKDRKTGKCRGFAFVTVPTDEAADQFIDKFNGQSFMESPLRIEKALPRTKGKGKDEDQAQIEPVLTKATSETTTSPTPKAAKKSGKKRDRSRGGGGGASTSGTQGESFQPDPRWAVELAKLKEMLTAQATNT